MGNSLEAILIAHSRSYPDSVALACPAGSSVSYKKLISNTHSIADQLSGFGYGRGDVLVLVAPNGVSMVQSLLGCINTCVCAPLNPAFRQQEYQSYFAALGARAVLVDSTLQTQARQAAIDCDLPVIDIEFKNGGYSLSSSQASSSFKSINTTPVSTDTALLLFSSGTTASPKLIPLTHLNLWHSVQNIARTLQLTARDYSLCVMPLFHIHGLVGSTLSSLYSGGSVLCAEGFKVSDFFELLYRYKPTWYSAVPTIHQAILKHAEGCHEETVQHTLRFIRSSSSPLTPSVMTQLERKFSVPVVEAYGMTEGTHQVASNPLPPAQRKAGSVGCATGTAVAVFGEGSDQPLAEGQTGEVAIRGGAVTKGYLGCTVPKAFIKDWLLTGDLGYIDQEGYLFLTGRRKEMINRGGEKVSPSEIDKALLEHPGIEQAASFGIAHETLGETVAAAVVLRANSTTNDSDIRSFVADRIADHKVPASVWFVEQIPLTATGKPQRHILAKEFQGLQNNQYVGATNNIEMSLQKIWSEALGREVPGIHDNFFMLGGDSLNALQIVARVRSKMSVKLPMRWLFESPTIAELSIRMSAEHSALKDHEDSPGNLPDEKSVNKHTFDEYLSDSQHANESHRNKSDFEIPVVSRNENMPMSYAEERFWFIHHLNSEAPVFQYLKVYHLDGALDLHALQESLNALMNRHEIFRTTFTNVDGVLSRNIAEKKSVNLQIECLDEFSPVTRKEKLDQVVFNECAHKIDLQNEAPIRIRLVKLSNAQFVFIIVLHHIIYDDKSLSVFWRELRELYSLHVGLIKAELPPLKIQYADYANWQKSIVNESQSSRLSYWTDKLADAPRQIDLPTDYPRPGKQQHKGADLVSSLSTDVYSDLVAICQKHNITVFMLLLSVFGLLLHRYSGQKTILVGSPVTNRISSEVESAIGCFLDTVVLRLDISELQDFASLLGRVKDITLDAFENRSVPFEKIVESLRPDRTRGVHPIFQVMFNFLGDSPAIREMTLPGMQVSQKNINGSISADFDLKLTVIDTGTQLDCTFTYSTELFAEETIRRMADHFGILLKSLLDHPEQKISNHSLLTDNEKSQILHKFNDTKAEFPNDLSLAQLFEKQVQKTPESTALIYRETQVQFVSLNDRANQLANFLLDRRVSHGDVVGVYLARSPDATVALLAILKIGAVYLPLDASYPVQRLNYMLSDSRAKFLITTSPLCLNLKFDLQQTLLFDKQKKIVDQESSVNPLITVSPDSCAYIVYTSGSTGKPSGVRLPHKQILNRLFWMWREYPFTADDVSCQKTALSFVDSLWELLGPLLQGSVSVVLEDETVRNPALLLSQLEAHRVSRLWVVPTLLGMMLESMKKRAVELPAMKFVVTSGEPLATSLLKDFGKTLPHAAIYNLYGTSEAWDSTWFDATNQQINSAFVPIGKPIDNVEMYILDNYQNPVPIGVTGQLYVGGVGLADGFTSGSAANQTEFVNKPWGAAGQLYGSGDYAKYLPDGNIEYLRRKGGHFKIRGNRVDPAEIETLLRQHPQIEEAVVLLKGDTPPAPSIIVFVKAIIATGPVPSITVTDIRSYLKANIPAYMVPGTIVPVEELPTTPSGKIDRLSLATMEISNITISESCESPSCELEAQILRVWETVITGKKFGVNDNFFDIGGHSLLAVQLFDKLSRLTGKPLELSMLFDAATVAEQAKYFQNLPAERDKSSLVTIQADGQSVPVFLVPPAAGAGLNFRMLSRYLDQSQPVYSFDLTVDTHGNNQSESLVDVASRLVTELQQVRPVGPYVVGGSCFGGVVAWEMARQLQESGHVVESVILIDTPSPMQGPGWSLPPVTRPSLLSIIHSNLDDLQKNSFSIKACKRILFKARRNISRKWGRMRNYTELRHYQTRVWQEYSAVALDLNVLIICSEEFNQWKMYHDRWMKLCGGRVEFKVMSNSTHMELLVDDNIYIEKWAGWMCQYLRTLNQRQLRQ